MARGYSVATATVTVTEDIVINGIDKSSSTSIALGSVAEVKTGIFNIPVDDAMILSFGADSAVESTLQAIQYIRLTNLDTERTQSLRFHAAEDTFGLLLAPGKSIILSSIDMDADNANIALGSLSFADMTEITALSTGGVSDLEYYVIGGGG